MNSAQNKCISGISFIKNGLRLGYPIRESVESIAPFCDEVIVNVGFEDKGLSQDDGTFAYLTSVLKDPKYKFIRSFWDPKKTQSGTILSEQTNIALDHAQYPIVFYIQGDEVVHEDDTPHIREALSALISDDSLDGIIFNYLHFFGNVDVYRYTRSMYRREVRIIRKKEGLRSFSDAQGFRFTDGSKPRALLSRARIFHYGWARKEKLMAKKVAAIDRLYHGDKKDSHFNYQRIYGLKRFQLQHPNIMEEWIAKNKNPIDIMSLPKTRNRKDFTNMLADFIEKYTDYRIGEFKNYILAKKLL